MRKNRKRQVHVKVLPPAVAGLIVLCASLVLIYWGMESKCAELGQEIRQYEQNITTLEDERIREETRWTEKKTPEKLEQAMLQHGLDMVYPSPEQIVRMDARGQPIPGQLALANFSRKQNAGERMVKAEVR